MYFCICDGDSNAPIFQAKLVAMFHHTTASKVFKEPVIGISIDPEDTEINDLPKFIAFDKEHIKHKNMSTKHPSYIREFEFSLPALRGKYRWGIWETKYETKELLP